MQDLVNRLKKNTKHRFSWAKRQGLTAFRLYDFDIPEWPLAIDWYADFVHVSHFPSRRDRQRGDVEIDGLREGIASALGVEPNRVFVKVHAPQAPSEGQRYERLGEQATLVIVEELGLKFECNLSDYLDTGLFMDHRNTRARVGAEAKGKRFLNLFAYTGAFSVHAIHGGASSSKTVDLSKTYGAMTERNYELNGFHASSTHQVLRDDALAWLETCRDTFDLIVCDPPSFSSSKKMGRRFDVQRDHEWLVRQCLSRLSSGGTLYFSTNLIHFELSKRLKADEELTPKSIPDDFRRQVHRCWRFTA